MYWHSSFTPAVKRLMVAAGLVAFFLTWMADIVVLIGRPDPFGSATSWLPVLVVGPIAALAVLDTPWSPSLLKRAAVVAVLSLALTGWSIASPPPGITMWWGALENASLLFLIIRVAAQVQPPAAAATATGGLAVAVLMLTARSDSWGVIVTGGYVLTVALAACVTIGCAVRAQEARRQRSAQDVRQAERLALARDLHDLIAHHMTGIIVQANAAVTVQAAAPDKVPAILGNIAQAGTETLESMRRLVRVLREENHAAVRPGDLLTEIGELVSAHTAPGTSGVPADSARLEATLAARTARPSPEAEISAVRLVQEALTNVRRHAPGTQATVHLDADTQWLRVTVTNTAPSRGWIAPAGGRGGFGLLGVRERMEALDGTLRTGPTPDGGWQVAAALPLPSAPPARRGEVPAA